MRWAYLVVAVLFVASGVAAYEAEMERIPNLQDVLRDRTLFLRTYFEYDPILPEEPLFGSPDAPVTIVLYHDYGEASSVLLEEVLPWLQDREDVAIYRKHAIRTSEDALLATVHDCMFAHDPAAYRERFRELFHTPREQALNMLDDIHECSRADEDEREARKLRIGTAVPQIFVGVDGEATTRLIGVPSRDRIEEVILRHRVRIGD